MNVAELAGVIGLVVAIGGAGAAWGASKAQARAIARELAELRDRAAGMGRRIGGLQTALAILASQQDQAERLAPYLDGGTGPRRRTAAQGINLLGADESHHETE